MGLLRWLRGGDQSTATSMISAGLAEIDGIFNPGRQKQTEHVEEMKRRRIDLANGSGIDPERGVAVIRLPPPVPDASDLPAAAGPPDRPRGVTPRRGTG